MGTFPFGIDSRHGPQGHLFCKDFMLFCKNIFSTGLLLLLSWHKNTMCRFQAVT